MRSLIYAPGLLLLLGAACTQPTAPDKDLILEVAVSRSVVAVGDTFSITVTASNPGRGVVELRPGEGCMPLDYRIYSAAGERLSPPVGFRCAVTGGLPEGWYRIGPGETRQVTHQWSAIYNYHDAAPPAQGLPPGEYRVVGGIAQEPDRRNPSAPIVIQVVTP